jgi:hypothetical protein
MGHLTPRSKAPPISDRALHDMSSIILPSIILQSMRFQDAGQQNDDWQNDGRQESSILLQSVSFQVALLGFKPAGSMRFAGENVKVLLPALQLSRFGCEPGMVPSPCFISPYENLL